MNKKIIATGAFLGMIAIILGAFGAHALKKVLAENEIAIFEIAIRYQMYHAIFLLFIGLLNDISLQTKKRIFYLVLFGVLFFSGSLYLLATKELTGINFKFIGLVTPLGGLLFIIAWGLLAFNYFNTKKIK